MSSNALDPVRITALLGERSLWERVESVTSTGSTNADLAALARLGEPEGRVLVASEQTAGRGRLDRTWVSPRGASLSLSMLLKPVHEFPRWGWLSLLTGMAVASALGDIAPDPSLVQLKWPNDVLIDGGKVCGILSERIEHPTGARAVVGVGLNLELTPQELPVPTATSLSMEGFPVDPEAIVAGVLGHMERYYRLWQRSGSLAGEYRARCSSVGSELTITVAPDVVVRGRGYGVDEFGRLQVATATGLETFAVGDVVHARLHR
ncbi:biotin--[acetyl-CoA-carboxylase] ligase [Tessaracoccus antarcticus]|uniref:biotin--[acetyl-CoA-carboxylase] ligase n=1 Tax=Tessaracoccus antarcticus TaxID=2479848 RepID=UPI0013145192|nr:biotin--[acetyl-CoA-carboxylase] ligase [Tessaracoccus antarcticus]